MNYKLYEVGGHVRDTLINLKSKDMDYSVVFDENYSQKDPETVFEEFCYELETRGYEVFLKTPKCLTVRAKSPQMKEICDFVLARKEVYNNPFSRTPKAYIGTLRDDLERRDFTVNALALDENGNLIDMFGGIEDLYSGILRTPKDTYESFNEDPLRILRAVRFHVTKDFSFSNAIYDTLRDFPIGRMRLVSEERIREELYKCFKHDTNRTIKVLSNIQNGLGFPILDYIFNATDIWLEPTNKK